ncbi:MAG: hypothetical protein ACE5NP_05795 [Anaerolineae bacterium]
MGKIQGFTLFESSYPEWPLSFLHPTGWEVRESIKDDFVEVFIAGPRNRADTFTTSIAVWGRAERDQTPEMLSKDHINRHRPLPSFQTLAQARGTLAGSEAVEVEITYKMPLPLNNVKAQMSPIRERRIFLRRGERIYELIYVAAEEDYETWLPAFQTVARTFAFREEPAEQRFHALVTPVSAQAIREKGGEYEAEK